jgi:hypothetical protein
VKPVPTTPTGAPIEICRLPQQMPSHEAELYRQVHAMHCARRETGHQCSGRVSIDKNGITLTCPLCGDARSVYPPT